jgi:hypothetical protein
LFLPGDFAFGGSERCVKEGSGNRHLSPEGFYWGDVEGGGSFSGYFERQMKAALEMERLSLSLWELCEGTWR